jgi:phage-related protein (TIGR01555 family)
MAREYKKANTAMSAAMRTKTPVPARKVTAGDGLENVIAGLGTDRDKRTYSSYQFVKPLTRYELENMYRCSWLSKRIVNSVADDMTQKWREFTFDDDNTNTQVEALEEAEKSMAIKRKFNMALRWARLYGGSVLVMGTRDALKPEDLKKPLDPTRIRKDDLKYIHVLDRWRVAPSGQLTGDILDPNFGLPEWYIITADAGAPTAGAVQIHHSRLLRFDGQELPYFAWTQNGWWHDSELQHVYDSLMNYDTVSRSLASMLFEANIDVISTEGLTELLSTKDGEGKLARRFQLGQLMKSFNRTLVLDSSETYEKKQNQFASLDKLWEQFMIDVSGASEIAMTRLFGISPSGLNSTGDSDLENYYGMVEAKRENQLRPQLDKFDQVFVRSVLGTIPADYDYEFNKLWQIDDKTRSDIEYQDAQRDQIYLTTGVVNEGLVASQLKMKGTYATMTADDVELAEELGEQLDEHNETMRDNMQASSDPENNPQGNEDDEEEKDGGKQNPKEKGNGKQKANKD